MKSLSFFLLAAFLLLAHSVAAIRVVSLSPMVTKAMMMLEAQEDVVACTQWCPLAKEKMVVANAIDVNVEQVLRVNPDIVFASTLTSKESLATLKKLGVKVIAVPRVISFDVMCDNLMLIAQKVGRETEAEREIQTARKALSEVLKSIPEGADKPRVMFQVGAKPIFVAIPNTFLDDFIQKAGGVNVYHDLAHGSVTRESVIQRNPSAIFISIMPAMAADTKATWMKYKELEAVQNNDVILIDQEKASSPTIHTFVEVVKVMVETLYN